MAYTQAGLPNGGNTNRFEIHYDTSLSIRRGLNLATELMKVCDSDYQWLKTYFPTAVVGLPASRIRIWIDNVTDPDKFLSASWIGFGLIPFDVNVRVGEMPITRMRAVDAVRWLILTEVSEMLMRERQGWVAWNDWFGSFNEGSKGEALSQVFGVEFIRTHLPGVISIPGESMSTSSEWLKLSNRPDFVSVNVDTNKPGAETGCGIQFLLYLHDQLGFSLEQIIANGGSTLANVYHNLTGDAISNAYSKFVDIVNLHYPWDDRPYDPPLETTFPAPNLTRIYADAKLSWIPNGRPPVLLMAFDNPIVAETTVHITSEDINVLEIQAKNKLSPTATSMPVPITVKQQPAGFIGKDVKLTATYAGRTMSVTVKVVPPEGLLPSLNIQAVSDDDRCKRPFEEGSSVTLYVNNIDIFLDQQGLKYTWVVNGATANALDTPQITIPMLPNAGTNVAIEVTVQNDAGLYSKGQLEISVLKPLKSLAELDRRVRCKIASMPEIAAFIPPWIPIIESSLTLEQVSVVRQLIHTSMKRMNEVYELLTQLEKRQSEERSGR
jgi:hypothetical protein